MEAQSQNNQNAGSEIAAFLKQWDQEVEVWKLLARGYKVTARHDFINKSMEGFGNERMRQMMMLEAKKYAPTPAQNSEGHTQEVLPVKEARENDL